MFIVPGHDLRSANRGHTQALQVIWFANSSWPLTAHLALRLLGLRAPPCRDARSRQPPIQICSDCLKLLLQRDTKHSGGLSRLHRGLSYVAYGTGALINETLSLTESDVDLRNNLVTLHRESALGKRTIPIGPSLLDSIRPDAELCLQESSSNCDDSLITALQAFGLL